MRLSKAKVNRLLQKFGFRISRVPTSKSKAYEPLFPLATYSPWNVDKDFLAIYEQIRDHTLVDVYRCYELWQITQQCAKLPSGAILEVGVWRGGTGTLIASQAKRCGIADAVYLCDTFSGVVKAGENDQTYRGGEHDDTSRESVEDLVRRMELPNVAILQGIFPEETGGAIDGMRFRFCHIDVDVYQSAKDTSDWVWDRLVPGGMVVYDDYGFEQCDGIVLWVEEQRDMTDRVVLHNLNGHAVVVKL